MAAAVARPQYIAHDEHSSLPHIDIREVAKAPLESKVDAVLHALVALGLGDVLCVDRVHKHYDLAANEVIVQRIDPHTSTLTMAPCAQPAGTAVPATLVPCAWVLVPHTGQWRVVMYTDVSGLPQDIAATLIARSERVQSEEAILVEVTAALRLAEAVGQLGVSLRTSAFAPVTAAQSMLETTYDDRSQRVYPAPKVF